MMSPKIFMIFLIVTTTTRGYDAQEVITEACATYNPTGEPIIVAAAQQHLTLKSALSLICAAEQQLPSLGEYDVVAIIGRWNADTSRMVEILAEVHQQRGYTVNFPNVVTKYDITGGTYFETFLPDWFFNNRTKTLFLNCLGFEDPRGPRYDIAAAHVNQLLLSDAKRVKFILVEDYRNLIIGSDLNALQTLLRHVTRLIRDTGEFSNSIALFASNAYSSQSDEQIIRNIASFLHQSQTSSYLNDKEIKLLDILLQQQPTYGTYLKIGCLRQIQVLQRDVNSLAIHKNKETLDEILYNTLRYTPVSIDSIGDTISDSSMLGIYQLVDEISTRIHSQIIALTRSIAKAYSSSPQVNGQIKTEYERDAAFWYLLEVKQKLEESEDLDHFLEETIPEMENTLKVTFEADIISTIDDLREYWELLGWFSNFEVKPKMWSTDFATTELIFWWLNNSEVQETESSETGKYPGSGKTKGIQGEPKGNQTKPETKSGEKPETKSGEKPETKSGGKPETSQGNTEKSEGSTGKSGRKTGKSDGSTEKPGGITGKSEGSTGKSGRKTGKSDGSTEKPGEKTGASGGKTGMSGGNTIALGGKTITPGRKTITLSGNTATSGGNKGTSEGNTMTFGGNSRTPGGNKMTFGGNTGISGGSIGTFGGNTRPFGGNTRISGGNIGTSGRNTRPFGGNTRPFGGNTRPFGGNTRPFGGNTRLSGGNRRFG